MYEFKRTNKEELILLVLALFLVLVCAFAPVSNVLEIVLMVIFIICLIAAYVCRVLKPDYHYTIVVTETNLIFEFSETDHRPISREFTAHVKKDKILLSYAPTNTRISVPYDDEVKDFLKKAMI